MTRHAILFGLNYEHTMCDESNSYHVHGTEQRKEFEGLKPLKGSINDVKKMKKMLSNESFHFDNIRTFTDNTCPSENCPKEFCCDKTTVSGILEEMNSLDQRSIDEQLEVAWIHFSGHAVPVYDDSYDERDWYDECIVPSDFRTNGYISDDCIREVLKKFNPSTKVVCVFDCNHSGTIGDLKYRFLECGESVHREHNKTTCEAKIILIGACQDSSSAFEMENKNKNRTEEVDGEDKKYSGGLTTSIVTSIKRMGGDPKQIGIHKMMKKVRKQVDKKVFNSQYPELTCSYFIEENETLF